VQLIFTVDYFNHRRKCKPFLCISHITCRRCCFSTKRSISN